MKNRLSIASTLAGLIFMLVIGAYTVAKVGISTMIPIHFDISGEPDGFAPAFLAILICPAALLGGTCLIGKWMTSVPPAVTGHLLTCHSIVVLTTVGAQTIICLHADEGRFAFASVALALSGIVIAIVSNGIGTLPRNTVAGIRNRWSLHSDETWCLVQRFSGRLGVAIGVAIAVSSVVLGNTLASVIVFFVLLTVLVVGTCLYSMYIAKNAKSTDV